MRGAFLIGSDPISPIKNIVDKTYQELYYVAMRITTQGEYALRCILNIAKNNGKKPVSISRIVSEEGLPLDYIEQLLMKLRRHKLIKSIRGVKGGYVLNRRLDQINVKDVLEAVEGDAFEVICSRRKSLKLNKCKEGQKCVLRRVWLDLKKEIDGFLEKETMKSLLNRS